MAHELLAAEMQKEQDKWTFSTKVYGTLYPTFRFYLIVASAVVAARESIPVLAPHPTLATLLAVSVTIVTAIDTWMKPKDKWRGFMKDRDDLTALRIRADAATSQGSQVLDSINTEFAELRRRHREENVW